MPPRAGDARPTGPDTAKVAKKSEAPKRFSQRFSKQETGPQRIIVGLAGTVTAVATCVGGVYAVGKVVQSDGSEDAAVIDSSSREPSSPVSPSPPAPQTAAVSSPPATEGGAAEVPVAAGQTLIRQGSPEADALVHALVDEPGARAELDVVILAQQKDKTPQWIMSLWYNCKGLPVGEPPGEDKCDEAVLVFDDVSPSPPLFDHPSRIELAGTWADNRPEGLRYGARGLEIYPVQASF